MAGKTKYVIGLALDDINNRRLEIVIFGETMTHRQAAELFQFGEDVVSAGFVHLGYNPPQNLSGDGSVSTGGNVTASVSGRSETLDIGPQPFDEYYVRRALGLRQRDATVRDRLEDFRIGRDIVHARRKTEPLSPRRGSMTSRYKPR